MTMEDIKTIDDLLKMTRKGEYRLVADIDGNGKAVKCLLGDFSGRLDGEGHRIRNLRISDEIWGDEQTLALFYSMSKAEIVDIVFEDIRFEYDRSCYTPRAAALAGSCSNSTIKNVVISVTDSTGADLTMLYEANDCQLQDNKISCNGKAATIVKFI